MNNPAIPLEERQELEKFNLIVRDHITHAREEHSEQSIEVALLSEVYEFLAELQLGDMTRAREEAADIVAVLWRTLCNEHNKEKENDHE